MYPGQALLLGLPANGDSAGLPVRAEAESSLPASPPPGQALSCSHTSPFPSPLFYFLPGVTWLNPLLLLSSGDPPVLHHLSICPSSKPAV